MAWLARSLANSLRLEDDGAESADGGGDGDGEEERKQPRGENDGSRRCPTDSLDLDRNGNRIDGESANEWQSRGVKEDLNELTESLTRQLWGVANFLAPPPSQPTTPSCSDRQWDRVTISGGHSNCCFEDMALRSREMDMGLEPIESEEEEEFEEVELVGVTDEVLAFARNIAMHPETWLDFPLDAEDDLDDFKMTDAQQYHAMAIENLAPRFRALRIELCPCHMSNSYFWKVYFVLLHSRLEKHDADILSTPQVIEARKMWMRELKKQTDPEPDWHEKKAYHLEEYEHNGVLQDEDEHYFTARSNHIRPAFFVPEISSTLMNTEVEKQASTSSTDENPVVEADIKYVPTLQFESFDTDDDDIEWPEDDSDLVGYSGAIVSMGMEEDISFSDLEDDSDLNVPIRSKSVSDDKGKGGL